jgi:hypothetical protein
VLHAWVLSVLDIWRLWLSRAADMASRAAEIYV